MEDNVITVEMVEDLLHRNKVDIEFEKKKIKRFKDHIEKLDKRIEKLLKDRAGLSEVLKKVKQNERAKGRTD